MGGAQQPQIETSNLSWYYSLHLMHQHRVKGELAMLAGMMGLCMLVMRLFPDSPTARHLHHHLAERPVAWFSRLDRRHLLLALITIGALLLAGEMIGMLGSADLMLAWTWDLTVYCDALAMTVVLGGAARVQPLLALARSKVIAWRATGTRARRSLTARAKSLRSDNVDSDEDHPGLYLLAA